MSGTELQLLIDELAVRRVLDEYCLRLECSTFAEWLDLFTEDTVYEVFRMRLRGRTELAEVLSQAPHGTHIGGACRIVVRGDTATALQNYIFIGTSSDEWNAGWYDRTLVRTNDGWKIAHTRIKIGRKDGLPENARARNLEYPITFD